MAILKALLCWMQSVYLLYSPMLQFLVVCWRHVFWMREYPFQHPLQQHQFKRSLTSFQVMLKMLTNVHKEIAFFLSLMPQTPWTDWIHSCKAKTSMTVSKSTMTYNNKPQNALPSLTLSSKMMDKVNLKLKLATLSASYSKWTTPLRALACSCLFVTTYSTAITRCQCYIYYR